MALNLNKESNDDKSYTSHDKKKGFNLNKSEDKSNSKINLSKGTTSSEQNVINSSKNDSATNSGLNLSKEEGTASATSSVVPEGSINSATTTNRSASSSEKGDSSSTIKKNKILLYALIGVAAIVAIIFMQLPTNNEDIPENDKPKTTEVTVGKVTSGSDTDSTTSTAISEDSGDVGESGLVGESSAIEGSSMTGGSSAASVSSANSQVNVVASSSAVGLGTLEEKAKQVIRGEFGSGKERKKVLGSEYEDIQTKVNEILVSRSKLN
jgi:hypothetical protein